VVNHEAEGLKTYSKYMNTTPSKRKTDEMFNANGIIAHSENLREVLTLGNTAKQPFLIYLVPRRTASFYFTNSLPPNTAV